MARKLMTLGVAMGWLVWGAGCGLDEPSTLQDEAAHAELTVLDAVGLGAAQSCHDIASTVDGSLAIRPLVDGDGLVLLEEDGDPLCIDSMHVISLELADIEDAYQQQIPYAEEAAETAGGEDVVPMVLSTAGKSDEAETDPNPQPALESTIDLGARIELDPGPSKAPDQPTGPPPSPDSSPDSSD